MEVWGGNEAAEARVEVPGLDAWVLSVPAGHAAGGDLHYFSNCATGRISRFLLADVAGHGPSVAAIAAKLRELLRKSVNFVSQERLVGGLNRGFLELSEDPFFASAVIGTYWAPNDWLLLSNAGHPRPLRYRAGRGEWETIDVRPRRVPGGPRNVPLGVVPDAAYDQVGLKLAAGDVVLCYSDALLDARRADGERLGEERLLELLRRTDAARPEALARALVDAVSAWAGDAPVDDCTVLVLRHTGRKPSLRGAGEAAAGFARLAWEALRGRAPFPWPECGVANLLGAVIPAANKLIGREAKSE
jgi:serine phosphatase RsbU (regulator of sigma subunit)